MKHLGLVILFSTFISANAILSVYAASPSLELGYCGSDFDVCYNSCRNNHPEASFTGDRARVICGQGCYQKRQQCEARVGGVVQRAPQSIAPLPPRPQALPQQAQPETEKKKSGILGWFNRPDRTKSVIPGKR